ncbi:MAG TPA: TIGR03435 family protein, partial [Bryobacteraceae bacterium]|nr:TIGR03435 family protein [Bryobacteraceae bacterium]
MSRSLLAALPALILLAGLIWPETGPEFDAASVKPNVSGDRRRSQRTEGRTFRASNVPARNLLLQAYGLLFEDYRLVGAPDWVSVDHFDVVATLPEKAPNSQVPAMLRAMLADRFKLAAHTETREAP